MKKIHLFTLLILFTSGYIYGQVCSSCRTSSFNYLNYGELDKAKEAIDFCITCEKSKTDPRVWFYRGMIYQGIQTSKEFGKLDPDAVDKAFEAYKLALLYNFVDPALQNLDIVNKQADQIKFFTALNDQKTKYINSEILEKILVNQFPALANSFVNKGVDEYQNKKDYEKAFKYFQYSLFVSGMSMTIDTPVIYYAALAAQKAKKYDESIELFKVVAQLNYGKDNKERAGNYYQLAETYKSKEDTAKYLETLKKGIDKYPADNTVLVVELINYYLTSNITNFKVTFNDAGNASSQDNGSNNWERGIPMKKGGKAVLSAQLIKGLDLTLQIYFDDKMVKETSCSGANCTANLEAAIEKDCKVKYSVSTPKSNVKAAENSKIAIDYLDLAIKNDSTNSTYWFAKGSMYDGNMKDPANAIICYKKAIQFKPDYFDANYNMGALYFNDGADLMNKANLIPADKVADYKAAKAKADDKLKEALPFLEKAHSINIQDIPTMESLKNIYYRLGMTDKMEAIKKEIDAIKK